MMMRGVQGDGGVCIVEAVEVTLEDVLAHGRRRAASVARRPLTRGKVCSGVRASVGDSAALFGGGAVPDGWWAPALADGIATCGCKITMIDQYAMRVVGVDRTYPRE